MSTENNHKCPVCGAAFGSKRSLASHKGAGHNKPWMDKDNLESEYIEKGRPATELSDEWGCDKKTIYNWLDKFGFDRRDAGHYCRKEYVNYNTSPAGYERWQLNAGEDRGRTVSVHRLAAVAWFGIESVAGKHVHHKNGVKWDNRKENVELLEASEHMRLHQVNGDIQVGTEAQTKGGYDPTGLFVGLSNDERHKGMYQEEMENSL